MSPSLQWIAFLTIVRKEIKRFMRIWVQTLVPPAITMALYFVIFGALMGPRIGKMGGFDYMAFVVPGLVMMAVINNAYSNVVSSFFGAKFSKSIEELQVSPTPSYVIIWGFVLGGVLRGLAVGAIVTLLSLFYTDLHLHNLLFTVLVVALASVLFALAGMINAIYANSFDDISVIPTFVLTPLTFFGGVFYSIDLLPPIWQTISQLNPILYVVNAFRYGILGISDVSVSASLVGIITFVIVLYAYCWYLLEKANKLRT